MKLHDVHQGVTARKKTKRVGRGPGSGHGKTSGRGHKGQGQLAGWTTHPAFEGGQFPLARRIPKRGFHNRFAKLVVSVNVCQLEEHFAAGELVTPAALRAKHLIPPKYDQVKILGDGELAKKLTVEAHKFSATAQAKIEAAGGVATVLEGPKPVVKNKQGSARRAAGKARSK